MRSIKHIGKMPAGVSILSDDLIEFHASRLIMLIALCGIKSRNENSIRIEGLTKLAKLDFFLRYPEFFQRAANHLNKEIVPNPLAPVESKMMRFHYGPWDERYYQILPFLEARGILQIIKEKSTYNFCLTPLGIETANKLLALPQFESLVRNLKEVKNVLGSFNGTNLKNLVYKLFEHEVADKQLREIISYEP